MLKEHLPRVIYHQVYQHAKIKPSAITLFTRPFVLEFGRVFLGKSLLTPAELDVLSSISLFITLKPRVE